MKQFKIFTDGSCKNNGKENSKGAYGFIVLDEDNNAITQLAIAEANTTNNRMELLGVIEAIRHLEDFCFLNNVENFHCQIYTDSAYIHNCYKQEWYKKWLSNGWISSTKQPVKNKELWEKLIPYFNDLKFSFHKVKGHTGKDDWNNKVDILVQTAANNLKLDFKV